MHDAVLVWGLQWRTYNQVLDDEGFFTIVPGILLGVRGVETLELLEDFRLFTEQPVMKLAPKKVFVQANTEIPLLLDYSGVAPDSWWSHWPTLSWEEGKLIKSGINPVKMVTWARKADHPDMGTVLDIARDLKVGCDLGTRGEYLCPSTSTNAPSAFEYGGQITDSIVDGLKSGIMIGPMNKDEIPFESIKVNGMLAVPKENGGVRICMNLSQGYPFCANKGQFNDERFEVRMSAMKSWLVSLNSAGQGCWFCKLDWSGARVVTLNQFQFGGRLRKHYFQRFGQQPFKLGV